MTNNSWYEAVAADAPLTQGGLLEDFPLVGWKSELIQVEQDKNLGESLRGATEIVQANVVVMTQACDLEHEKVANVILCPFESLAEHFSLWKEAMQAKAANCQLRIWWWTSARSSRSHGRSSNPSSRNARSRVCDSCRPIANISHKPSPAFSCASDCRFPSKRIGWRFIRESYGIKINGFGSLWRRWHARRSSSLDERMRKLRGDISRLDEIARRIVTVGEETLDGARHDVRTEVVLKHRAENIELPYRRVTPAEKDASAAEAAKFKDDPQQRWNYRWNQRVVDRFEPQASGTQPPYVMELHALRLGDVAIATNDFELYTDHGVQIKARSPAVQTFVIQLAGPGGYLPTARAARHGATAR